MCSYLDPYDLMDVQTHPPSRQEVSKEHAPMDSEADFGDDYGYLDASLVRELWSFLDMINSMYHYMPTTQPCTEPSLTLEAPLSPSFGLFHGRATLLSFLISFQIPSPPFYEEDDKFLKLVKNPNIKLNVPAGHVNEGCGHKSQLLQ